MLKNVRSLLTSEGVKSTVLVAFGNIVSTGLGAIAMIMAFRLVTPAEFGIFSAVFAIMMIVVKFADMGTNVALQRLLAQPVSDVTESEKKSTWGFIFVFKLAVGITLVFLSLLLAPSLAVLTGIPAGYLIIGVVSALGMIIYDQAVVTAQAMHQFGLSVAVSALQSVLKIAGLGLLYRASAVTPSSLILLYGLAPLFGSLLVPWYLALPLGKINWDKSRHAVWHIARFTSIAILSAALADNLDILMIQSMLGAEGAGIYSSASKIAGFMAIVGFAVGVVLNVRVARYKSQEHLDLYLKKAAKLAFLSLIVLLVFTPFAKYLILITAGSAYLEATATLQYLLVATGLVMATSPYVALFYTFDQPQYFAISGIMIATLLLLGNYIFIPLLGIEGAAVAKLATRFLVFIYTYWYAHRSYHEAYRLK